MPVGRCERGNSFLMRGFLASLLVVPLTACDRLEEAVDKFVEEQFYEGTVKGVEMCVSRNRSDIVSAEVVRRNCALKHEGVGLLSSAGGTASFQRHQDRVYGFTGNLINESSTEIITRFRITAKVVRPPGPAESSSQEFSGRWIEPGQSSYFAFDEIPEDWKTSEVLVSCLKSGGGDDCWYWVVDEVRAIRISAD
jgi:hypothetical protein